MEQTDKSSANGITQISVDQFLAVDIRVGKVLSAIALKDARKAAYVLTIDFGEKIGIKKSSAQITENYTLEQLPDRLVIAVVNFPPRQIGKVMSEVLTLGFPDADGAVVLCVPDREIKIGARLL